MNEVQKALRYLAGVCDYANKKDERGFNAFDADFGHSLASQPFLTTGQEAAATKMLRKYKKQLEEAGIKIEFETDPQPGQSIDKPCDIMATDRIYLYFAGKPSEAVRASIKQIAGWRWHPELSRYPWSVPIDRASDVEALFGVKIELPEQPVASKSISSEKDVIIRMNGKFNVYVSKS